MTRQRMLTTMVGDLGSNPGLDTCPYILSKIPTIIVGDNGSNPFEGVYERFLFKQI